jgi:hypothetical protein
MRRERERGKTGRHTEKGESICNCVLLSVKKKHE